METSPAAPHNENEAYQEEEEDEQEDEQEDPDMASAMGFSSFGAQPHQPRRKKQKLAQRRGTGGNDVPLGAPRAGRSGVVKVAEGEDGVFKRRHEDKDNSKINNGDAEELEKRKQEVRARVDAVGIEDDTLGNDNGHASEGPLQRTAGGVGGDVEEEGFEGHSWREWRQGVRDAGTGDVAFYDASFVEDPWGRLKSRNNDVS